MFGMVTLVIFLLSKKASLSMLLTPLGIVTFLLEPVYFVNVVPDILKSAALEVEVEAVGVAVVGVAVAVEAAGVEAVAFAGTYDEPSTFNCA